MTGLASLSALEGRWQLEREIKHADGSVNRLTGEAHFHRSGKRLVQDETGSLFLGTQTVKATRRYIWAEGDGLLEVYFEDMRPFHTVLLGVTEHQTVHLCDPDRYEVSYDFSQWPKWCAKWTVEGPRKHYEMNSTYRLN